MKVPLLSTNSLEQAQEVQYASGIRWTLDDVLPAHSGKLFTGVLERLEAMLVEFESQRSQLKEDLSASKFQSLLRDYDQIMQIRAKLGSYAYMYFSEDTKSQDSRTFKSRAEEVDTDAANRTLFFELWWKSLGESEAGELVRHASGFEYFLEKLRKTKPYTLSEQVEQVINLKDSTGRSVLLQLYHQIVDSLLFEVSMGDKKKKVTQEQLRDLFYSKVREERKSAYSAFLSKAFENRDVIGEIYKSLVRDWRNEGIKLRKYSSSISIRNIGSDVPDEAVETLLSVCRENSKVFQSFFRIKSKLLGQVDFARYDLYAPLEMTQKVYSWAEGMDLVLGTFGNFNSEFASMAKKVFVSSHIDAESREAKLSGAYCMSVSPAITPYILITYTGTARSVSTLAHELGHAVHAQLSSKRGNSQLEFEAPLPLAETASVFGEQLLIDRLMSEADDATRLALLVSMLDDAYGTIQRQAFFALFEKDAHEKIASGVNVDELSDLYLESLRGQFGSSILLPDDFKSEWLGIPHIFQTPFYCYAYAWGNLMVLALYKQFKQEGARDFAPRYLKLLSYGGSEAPEKILAEAGFDIRSKGFWQSGFDEIARSISELEKIV
ncbi:MAG: M3 family oligoendopeptidase [Nitrososphaerales archaeon]